MNLLRFCLIGLCAASLVFLSACATAPPPTQSRSPEPIYDEEGRPLWIPPPVGRTPTGSDMPPREFPQEAPEGEAERIPDRTGPPPRIGSNNPEDTEPATDDHRIAAVSSLEERAEHELSIGQVDQAFSTAERAIRIDPTNPDLWNLLARIQLNRSNFVQAEQLARKSNLLARGDRALQARNWRIISNSLNERGQTEKAKKALQKAWELE